MERRHFLSLLATPAFVSLLEACGGDSTGGTTIPADGVGYEVVRSSVSRLQASVAESVTSVRALNSLGWDLHRILADEGGINANSVLSPVSVLTALAMTRAGAVGDTATQMDAALHLADGGADPGAVHHSLNALTAALGERSGDFEVNGETVSVELNIANSLWGQRGMEWLAPFLDTLATEYGAGMQVVDYAADTEGARRAINGWVSTATKRRIPELLARGTLTPDSRLTLVNAVYMKAPWQTPFVEQSTSDGEFTTLAGGTVSVPMMRASLSLSYSSGAGWQAVELPYAGDKMAMTLIVPDAGEFAAVESQLAGGLADTAIDALIPAQVDLAMPRFDVDNKFELTKAMESLGMTAAFDPGLADFSAMTADAALFISFIIHQANITVDEKGTEAAAATAVGMSETAAPGMMVELAVDRPFLYVVRDRPTGAVLFMGRVVDPS